MTGFGYGCRRSEWQGPYDTTNIIPRYTMSIHILSLHLIIHGKLIMYVSSLKAILRDTVGARSIWLEPAGSLRANQSEPRKPNLQK